MQMNFRFTSYLLVFLFVNIWGAINRIQNLFEEPVFVLMILQSIFTPLAGLLNAIVFASQVWFTDCCMKCCYKCGFGGYYQRLPN